MDTKDIISGLVTENITKAVITAVVIVLLLIIPRLLPQKIRNAASNIVSSVLILAVIAVMLFLPGIKQNIGDQKPFFGTPATVGKVLSVESHTYTEYNEDLATESDYTKTTAEIEYEKDGSKHISTVDIGNAKEGDEVVLYIFSDDKAVTSDMLKMACELVAYLGRMILPGMLFIIFLSRVLRYRRQRRSQQPPQQYY